jgi:hypothetical protein
MKKILLSVLVLQMVFFVGCSEIESPSQATENSGDVGTVSEETHAKEEKNQSIYEKFQEVYDLQRMDEVLIRKINEEKFLVGFQEQFGYRMNPIFHIYDLEADNSIPIDGQLEYIDEIRIENNQIEFFSKGTNIINGFKKFPNITTVDIETGLTDSNNIYSRLGSDYKPFFMGNFLNETKLDVLEIVEEKIMFDFSVSENSILAGGDHCPNIEVISENENTVSVDIENLILAEDEIMKQKDETFIKAIEISSYFDGRDIHHSVIDFTIEGYSEYSCSFETGNDGIRDLIVTFK